MFGVKLISNSMFTTTTAAAAAATATHERFPMSTRTITSNKRTRSSCSNRTKSCVRVLPRVNADDERVGLEKEETKNDRRTDDQGRNKHEQLLATIAQTALPAMFYAEEAFAKGGEFGVLEGRTAALVHPFFLATMYFTSLYAGYLGLQWKKVRTVGEEIQELKKQGQREGDDASNANQTKIDELTKERKELVAGNYKEKHFNAGSLLLAFGTILAIEGGMNTYIRTGKLFPGPHLFAGMGIVALWAAAAGLVPEMQRGNDKARQAHIALNAVNVLLFTWQIPTGLEIVGKVFQFTSWP